MKTPRQHHGRSLDVKMTPMIDVVFLLLIFFVWTSSFELPEFDLPGSIAQSPASGQAAAAETAPEVETFDEIVIRLGDQPGGGSTLRLNDQPVADLGELRRRLEEILALGVQPPVIVDPNESVTMDQVIDAYDAARSAGADRVLFATRS